MKLSKSQSGFSSVVIPLILIALGIIGFTGWKVYQTSNTIEPAASSTIPTPDPKPETIPNTPEGFVEYRNEELGFRFAYPKEWGSLKTSGFEGGRFYEEFEPNGGSLEFVLALYVNNASAKPTPIEFYEPKNYTKIRNEDGLLFGYNLVAYDDEESNDQYYKIGKVIKAEPLCGYQEINDDPDSTDTEMTFDRQRLFCALKDQAGVVILDKNLNMKREGSEKVRQFEEQLKKVAATFSYL